jgi:acetyltransferase-like isoleucine patch superfamily enzyme
MTEKNAIHESSKLYGNSAIGEGTIILEKVILGYPEHSILMEIMGQNRNIEDCDFPGCTIGSDSIVRPGSTLFSNVSIGNKFKTGHNVLVGSNVIIDGNVTIGNNVSIQGNAYIPTNVVMEDNVFIGPCAVLTNDKYPIRKQYELRGPTLRKGASVGANATIMPGVEIGEGSLCAGVSEYGDLTGAG